LRVLIIAIKDLSQLLESPTDSQISHNLALHLCIYSKCTCEVTFENPHQCNQRSAGAATVAARLQSNFGLSGMCVCVVCGRGRLICVFVCVCENLGLSGMCV